MLLPLLPLLLFHGLEALPIEPKTLFLEPSPRRFDRLISSVERKIGESDIIHPSVCPSSCEHLHQAMPYVQNHSDINFSIKECSCICPLARPAYVSTIGGCAERLNECSNTIRWKSINSAIPVVQLRPHTIILPDDDLDFRGAGIRTSSRGADEWNCSMKKIMYENLNTKWRSIAKERGLFQLTSSNGKPIVYFGGTEFDASFLAGAIVMIKLECRSFTSSTDSSFCLSLRIAGTSGISPNFDHKQFDMEETGWRVESIFFLIVVALIIIVIIITFIVWNICWSIKKRKLISDFQMQFVQQYKHHNQGLAHSSIPELEEIDQDEILQSHSQSLNRKRLIFSSEYFDPAQMIHPSPLAIQFLYDLRRVVDIAKERIRQRRFIPALPVILEDPVNEVDYEDEVVKPKIQEPTSSEESLANTMTTPESSPRSDQKSVDSGRESRDGDDSDEDDVDEKKEEIEMSKPPPTQTKVSDIVKSFEKSNPRPSYVPIMLNSSMRKKKNPLSTPPVPVDNLPPNPPEPAFRSRIKAPTAFTDRRRFVPAIAQLLWSDLLLYAICANLVLVL
ncbi:hypothetical protein CAEBREN_14951 [Caenorhabditis brenneri]|uniref:Shavenoid isoform B-like N-terminal domain-containing protein n=1 Tax=Caenorhabditis brenneri TaxID=135651 RepID=G0MJK5_CAEBE|nr:hypothetical protein CAEBREN_14951 [Caenorhabditis brenneri]